jgi:hypothetical protein
MALRLAKVSDEHQLLFCMKNHVWGSKLNRFGKWETGDLLVFIVEKNILALAEISEQGYFSNDILWEDDLYPYRITVKFKNYLLGENKIPFPGTLKHCTNLGFKILTQTPVPKTVEQEILCEVKKFPNSIKKVKKDLEKLLAKALKHRGAINSRIKYKE